MNMDVIKGFLKSRHLKLLVAGFLGLGVFLSAEKTASAGVWEFSAAFSYNRSNYSDQNFNWTRRIGLGLGYYFTERSEIEFSAQDVIDRTSIQGFEDTTFHDQIYSLNWIQYITDKDAPFQPYLKLGVGQLNREASGSYALGVAPPAILDEVTVIIGGGAKLFITKSFGLRLEAVSYVAGGSISTWDQNFSVTMGLSVYF
jgi:hypothetical protein